LQASFQSAKSQDWCYRRAKEDSHTQRARRGESSRAAAASADALVLLQLPTTAIREIKILKSLSHPNMVSLVEMITSKGREDKDLAQYEPVDESKRNTTPMPPSHKGNLFLALEYVEHDLSGLLDVRYNFTPVVIKVCAFSCLVYLFTQAYTTLCLLEVHFLPAPRCHALHTLQQLRPPRYQMLKPSYQRRPPAETCRFRAGEAVEGCRRGDDQQGRHAVVPPARAAARRDAVWP
jgi:serine/threonine protein kinase